ncbi:unnamed protein product, partial [marine sediment metagenome]
APDFGDLIDALSPVLWDRDERVAAGFTVEQFESVGDADGWTPALEDGLVYTELVVPLWSEVKALRERVAALEPA